MKKDIHPENYRPVIFEDTASGTRFLIASTAITGEKDRYDDGKEYPLVKIEISSASHPFYTGQAKVIDTAGRVEKFKARSAVAKSSPKKTPSKKKK
jgi:large subunit ribosomal protein L31